MGVHIGKKELSTVSGSDVLVVRRRRDVVCDLPTGHTTRLGRRQRRSERQQRHRDGLPAHRPVG